MNFTLNEGVGRWHVTSGKTIAEGWRSIGPWATGYFGIYTLIWGFVYGAAGMSSCALAMTTMFPVIPLWAWAIIHGLVGFILIWSGKYKMFENVMTLLVGLMFITVVGSALLVIPDLGHIMNTASPSLPKGSLIYALGLIGGVGGLSQWSLMVTGYLKNVGMTGLMFLSCEETLLQHILLRPSLLFLFSSWALHYYTDQEQSLMDKPDWLNFQVY